ncbi:MAG: hypothetical protein KF782_17950 [Labilithrix sp.]|nr:hypothetical protein [Labilithrix sp.]
MRNLADDDDAPGLTRRLLAAACEGVLTLRRGAAWLCDDASRATVRRRACPCPRRGRSRARRAVRRGDERAAPIVPRSLVAELAVVLAMDGARAVPEIAAEATRRTAEVPSSLAGPLRELRRATSSGSSTRYRPVHASAFLVEEDAT